MDKQQSLYPKLDGVNITYISEECHVTFDGQHVQWTKLDLDKEVQESEDGAISFQSEDILAVDWVESSADPSKIVIVVHYTDRLPSNIWQHSKVQIPFKVGKKGLASQWKSALQIALDKAKDARPKKLLVFINPVSGEGKCKEQYDKVVGPLFKLSGIKADVIETKNSQDAKDTLEKYDLSDVDGIICGGGDGTVNVIANAYYSKYANDNKIDLDDTNATFRIAPIPIGVLPLGSVQMLAMSTAYGVRDLTTSALRIISGETQSHNAISVHNNNKLMSFALIGVGCISISDLSQNAEQRRHLGMFRYVLAGIQALWNFRDADIKIQYKKSDGEWVSEKEGRMKMMMLHLYQKKGKDGIKRREDDMLVMSVDNSVSRIGLMRNFETLMGKEEQMASAQGVECIPATELKVTFDKDNIEHECIGYDGETCPISHPEVHFKFHKNVFTLFGDSRQEVICKSNKN